jgi:hypothetical protein
VNWPCASPTTDQRGRATVASPAVAVATRRPRSCAIACWPSDLADLFADATRPGKPRRVVAVGGSPARARRSASSVRPARSSTRSSAPRR